MHTGADRHIHKLMWDATVDTEPLMLSGAVFLGGGPAVGSALGRKLGL